jgi:hypothetical protein
MSFVNTVDIIGDEALTNSIIDRSITEIADNLVTSIGDFAFYGCKLTTANFPAVTSIGTNVFRQCSTLTTVDFSVITSIDSFAFCDCSGLTALILRSETRCSLNSTNVFNYSSIESGTGYIYVPRALVDSYKAASNWSTYSAQFRALEDYTVDGTTTGALDETKI